MSKKCKCKDKVPFDLRYSIEVKDSNDTVSFSAFYDGMDQENDCSGNDATWRELLLRFRSILKTKGYDWTDEDEDTWRNLINNGIEGDLY
jgi:hypothetical protein